MRPALRPVAKMLSCMAILSAGTACNGGKPTPSATPADVEAARQEVAAEVAKAKAEASKDVRSAAKVSGGNSRDVTEAKVVGSYDVAMVQADGEHKIAVEKCLTETPDVQGSCNAKADADYETAKAAAKASRLAKRP